MEEKNKIVVFQVFNNGIDANIVKTKLDAYGIPCFLSHENTTHLTSSVLSGGVRLYIFEQDRDQAQSILLSDLVQKADGNDVTTCPNCRSKRILNVSRDQFDPARILKFFLQLSKTHYCLDCETEFDQ